MRRLVVYWAGVSLRPSRTGSTLPEPVEQCYPSEFKGVSGFFLLGRMLLRGIASAIREGRTVQAPVFEPGGPTDVSLVELVFDTAVTTGFIAACRRSGVTVHAALGAAQLLAVFGEVPEGAARRLGLTSTVDLRKKMVPRVSDGVPGVYFSMIRTTHSMGREQDFYELAKDLEEQITKSIERGHAHLAWLALGQIARLGLRGFSTLSNRIPSSTTFSHLGHTPARLPDGDFRILAVSGTVCPTPLTPMVTMTNLFDGRLFASISYDPSKLSDERASVIAGRFQSIVQGIADTERLST